MEDRTPEDENLMGWEKGFETMRQAIRARLSHAQTELANQYAKHTAFTAALLIESVDVLALLAFQMRLSANELERLLRESLWEAERTYLETACLPGVERHSVAWHNLQQVRSKLLRELDLDNLPPFVQKLVQSWRRDQATFPVQTDIRAQIAAVCLRACTRELGEAARAMLEGDLADDLSVLLEAFMKKHKVQRFEIVERNGETMVTLVSHRGAWTAGLGLREAYVNYRDRILRLDERDETRV